MYNKRDRPNKNSYAQLHCVVVARTDIESSVEMQTHLTLGAFPTLYECVGGKRFRGNIPYRVADRNVDAHHAHETTRNRRTNDLRSSVETIFYVEGQ